MTFAEKLKELRKQTRIVPIRDLKNTTAISNLCHEDKEPIFVTKNGYGVDMTKLIILIFFRLQMH